MWKIQGGASGPLPSATTTGEAVTDDEGNLWVFGADEFEAISNAQRVLQTKLESDVHLTRDEDVLDTWFSSALLPFSNFHWPQHQPGSTKDFSKFYPLSLMETGHDILFFWVARMVMVAHLVLGNLPFKVCLSFSLRSLFMNV